MKQALVLAGGKGTRLRERLNGRPKPLIDIAGTPLLQRQLELLRRYGFESAIVLVNHQAQQIVDFCAAHGHFGMALSFVDDGAPLGTAGAVLAMLDRAQPRFLVVYGDTMLDVDLDRLWRAHAGRDGVAATIFLHPNDHPQDSDLVEIDDEGRVLCFHPYPHPEGSHFPNLVNAALYVVERAALEPWRSASPPLDFAKDLFPRMLAAGSSIAGYVSPEYIKDAGTPERVDKVERDVRRGVVAAANLAVPQTAVFIDRDGTLNVDPGHLCRLDQMRPFPHVGSAMRRLNDAGLRTVLVTNQPVVARGDCSVDEVRRINAKLEWVLARDKAYLDRIYFCPHHPDRGFAGEVSSLKIACDCRKPAPGMLLRAQRDLNIDLQASWFIGDGTADAGAAAQAGVTSVLVETGAAGLDDRYPYVPDFIARDFPDAVRFILDRYPRLRDLVEETLPQPVGRLVFVGGLSRSGKSSLSSALAREWRLRGHDAIILRADRWLRSEADREPAVLGRYDTHALVEIVRALAQRKALTLDVPTYSRRRRQRLPAVQRLAVGADASVIVVGVVAAELARRCGMLDSTVNVRTEEGRRRERVLREYRLRGWSDGDAERVYAEREADEHAPLRELGERAAWTLDLDPVFADPQAADALQP
ncbi:MAG: HAD-IIIA family hydrolase [Betaproteobacteria bacterium]